MPGSITATGCAHDHRPEPAQKKKKKKKKTGIRSNRATISPARHAALWAARFPRACHLATLEQKRNLDDVLSLLSSIAFPSVTPTSERLWHHENLVSNGAGPLFTSGGPGVPLPCDVCASISTLRRTMPAIDVSPIRRWRFSAEFHFPGVRPSAWDTDGRVTGYHNRQISTSTIRTSWAIARHPQRLEARLRH